MGLSNLLKLNLTMNLNYIGFEGIEGICKGFKYLSNLQNLTFIIH